MISRPASNAWRDSRNVLAHGYTELIAERVHAALAELDDIRAYVAAVSEHLEA
jgi:uncharacterized protein YutE (UPF0331/DUF86 family)